VYCIYRYHGCSPNEGINSAQHHTTTVVLVINMTGMTGRQDGTRDHSALNRVPPSPPRMIAFMNEKNRSEYSDGGTGLILC
jgi:hypothetical protein